LSGSLHETSFLPARRAMAIAAVRAAGQSAQSGGRLYAVRQPSHVELQGFADSLGQLGSFVLGQLHLLQRLRRPQIGRLPVSVTEHQ
jgi:sigma-54-dependent transcriptional regulator